MTGPSQSFQDYLYDRIYPLEARRTQVLSEIQRSTESFHALKPLAHFSIYSFQAIAIFCIGSPVFISETFTCLLLEIIGIAALILAHDVKELLMICSLTVHHIEYLSSVTPLSRPLFRCVAEDFIIKIEQVKNSLWLLKNSVAPIFSEVQRTIREDYLQTLHLPQNAQISTLMQTISTLPVSSPFETRQLYRSLQNALDGIDLQEISSEGSLTYQLIQALNIEEAEFRHLRFFLQETSPRA